ncbi:universal stress protein [Albimonas pacifica]|uniref:Universal stress protein family protein n=1 Tax=Albimonas pacifica TaxID=1114924 RepID=A0A1I3LXE8_9RHOB|nr:universal stress protein [Albimonas pacifica]SFI89220.1 Universal stress protein family protein [Albimonas pacifica]
MAIKNILVCWTGLPGAEDALRLAALMARRHDAHLTGMLVHGTSRAAAALGPWIPSGAADPLLAAERERRAAIAAAFHELTRELERDRPGKTHYVEIAGEPDAGLIEAARVYDIVVVGRDEADGDSLHLAPHPDLLALRCGRPVLIVPPGCRIERLADRAILAWDGGKAAARALSDAMAILETQAHVSVVTVGDPDAARGSEGRDVVAHLARHGIQADLRRAERGPGGVAAALRAALAEQRSGLLVMGAYEHSRLAEEILGGVTRRILAELDVPVLMAH